MYSESQNDTYLTPFCSNTKMKQDSFGNDIYCLINTILNNENNDDSVFYEFNILKNYSKSGHADSIYQSIIQKLPSYFKEVIFSHISNGLNAHSFINIFNFFDEKLKILSDIFEGSKYYPDKQGKSTLPKIGYKIMKKCISDNNNLYQILINVFNDLFMQFRQHINDCSQLPEDDYQIFFKVTQIIAQLKMIKKFTDAASLLISSDYLEALPRDSGSAFLSALTKILDSELDKLKKFPIEFTKIIMLPIRTCLYSKPLEECLEKFTNDFLQAKNSQALSMISSLIIELKDPNINDKFIEILSEWTINNTMSLIDRNSVSCISELIDLFFLFQSLVKTYNISQCNYCLKYFKGCLVAYGNRIAYLTSRYIHQQIQQQVQQNTNSFIQRIPDILNFLIEIDSVPYLFLCFRQFLGLRTLYYFPEKFMSDSELLNQIGIIFTIDQKNLLNQMYPDLQESNPICSEFKSNQTIPISFRVTLLSVEKWPSYPQFPLKVDNNILTLRNEFETFYYNKFPNKKIKWIDSLETCVFTYQGYNIVAYTVQYIALTFLKKGKDFSESGIPKEYHSEIISSLVRAGILLHKNGKLSFLKLKQPQKTIRINTITINYPERIKEKDEDEIFFSQRKRINANIMIVLKTKNELSYSKLYRKTQDLIEFPLTEKSFKCCLSGLLAQQMIVKGNDKVYRYFPI